MLQPFSHTRTQCHLTHCLYRESLAEKVPLHDTEITTQLGMLEECHGQSMMQPTTEAFGPEAVVQPQPQDQKYEKMIQDLQALKDLHSLALITDDVYTRHQDEIVTLYRSSKCTA